MSNGKSVMIVGVGGQGTLLASRLLGAAMTAKGFDVKVSEVHGMSQRGGSVVTYVRYGEKVYSPIIEEGEADIVLAFEQLEAARYLPYLKKGGAVVVNTQKMDPMPVVTGAAKYPEGVLDAIAAKGVQVLAVDALSLAEQDYPFASSLCASVQPVSYNFGIAIGSFIGSAVQEGWGFRPLGLPAAMFALAALGLNLLLLRANGRRTAAAAS